MSRYIPKKKRLEIFERNDHTCQRCGGYFRNKDLQVDHTIPLRWGGEDEDWNRRATCRKCNRQKSDKLPGIEDMLTGRNLPGDSVRRVMNWDKAWLLRASEGRGFKL